MNIYLLKRRDDLENPYREADYDEAEGFIIVADNSTAARDLAMTDCGDEGKDVWRYAAHSTCRKVGTSVRNQGCILLRSFKHG